MLINTKYTGSQWGGRGKMSSAGGKLLWVMLLGFDFEFNSCV